MRLDIGYGLLALFILLAAAGLLVALRRRYREHQRIWGRNRRR